MFDFIRTRLQQGMQTSVFPPPQNDLPERFRGLPVIVKHDCTQPVDVPSAMIAEGDGQPVLDVGSCLFSPEEAVCTPVGEIEFTRDYRMSSSTRDALISPQGEIKLARALEGEMQRLFKRSLRLRSVVAGSCGGCEAELVALGNVVFDLARFGIQFVASPRHADGIVITGTVNENMRIALEKTFEAVPQPKIVIAVGACAISGGPFQGSDPTGYGVPSHFRVDLYVPGCPPHPLTLLDGLLRLLGRMPAEHW